MTPLHHACRMMVRAWARKLLEWDPSVANMVTYPNAKPSKWTPLQCLLDNPVMEVLTIEQAKAMVSDLVEHMNEDAIRNQTGFVERGGGKRSGGLNVLHALVSRKSPLFFYTADQIRTKFGDKVAIEMMNTTTGDGRGVVDMALGANVQMATDLKSRFNGAVEQTTSRRFQAEKGRGRRQWQRGESDWKTHGVAKYRSDRAKWGEARPRTRGGAAGAATGRRTGARVGGRSRSRPMTGVIGRRRKSRHMTGRIGPVRPPLAVAGVRAGAAIGGAGEG